MTRYRERLWASVSFYLASALVIPAVLLVFAPISLPAGVIVALALYGLAVLLLVATSARIEIADGVLHAGRARVAAGHLGEVEVFDGAEATAQRGPRLDARAWLLIRGWVKPVVKVEIRDEADPVPYWLISTRRPAEFAAALEEARDAATRPRG